MRYMLSFQCESQEEAQAVLTAVAAIDKEPHACSKQYVPPKEILEKPAPIERKNISPGTSAIGKIGTNTKEQLLGMLADGNQPPEKWTEHLKLLWSRNEVKWDGSAWYL